MGFTLWLAVTPLTILTFLDRNVRIVKTVLTSTNKDIIEFHLHGTDNNTIT